MAVSIRCLIGGWRYGSEVPEPERLQKIYALFQCLLPEGTAWAVPLIKGEPVQTEPAFALFLGYSGEEGDVTATEAGEDL